MCLREFIAAAVHITCLELCIYTGVKGIVRNLNLQPCRASGGAALIVECIEWLKHLALGQAAGHRRMG